MARCERQPVVGNSVCSGSPDCPEPAQGDIPFDGRVERLSSRLAVLKKVMAEIFDVPAFKEMYSSIATGGDHFLEDTNKFRLYDKYGVGEYAYWFAMDCLSEAAALEKLGYHDRAEAILGALGEMLNKCEKKGGFFVAALNMGARLFLIYKNKAGGVAESIRGVMALTDKLEQELRSTKIPLVGAFDAISLSQEDFASPLELLPKLPDGDIDRYAIGQEVRCIDMGNLWRYEGNISFNRALDLLVRELPRGKAVTVGGCDLTGAALLTLYPEKFDIVSVITSSGITAIRAGGIHGRIHAVSEGEAETARIDVRCISHEDEAETGSDASFFLVKDTFEFQDDEERKKTAQTIRKSLMVKGRALIIVPLKVPLARFEMPDGSLLFRSERTFELDALKRSFEGLGFSRTDGFLITIHKSPANPEINRPEEAYIVISRN